MQMGCLLASCNIFYYVLLPSTCRFSVLWGSFSHSLDVLWRGTLSSAGTSSSVIKTNYSQITMVLVYWGCAPLLEPLQAIYSNTRTLRWLFSHIGWDMPIEKFKIWKKRVHELQNNIGCTEHIHQTSQLHARRPPKSETFLLVES